MSATLSTQTHLFPYSGDTMLADGDGMSTRFALDLVRNLNNLGGYCDLRVLMVTCPTDPTTTAEMYGYVERTLHSAEREIYVCQVPIVGAVGAKRLVWTCGVNGYASGGTTDIASVSAYLAAAPYTGAGPTTAFDVTNLAAGYRGPRTVELSINTGTDAYELADDSTTGFVPAPQLNYEGQDTTAYLILTATGQGTGAQGKVRICDFTAWYLYE